MLEASYLPFTAKIADQLTFVKRCNTEAINRDPAVTMFQIGFTPRRTRCMEAGLPMDSAAETSDLPAFCADLLNERREASRFATDCGAAPPRWLPFSGREVLFSRRSRALPFQPARLLRKEPERCFSMRSAK